MCRHDTSTQTISAPPPHKHADACAETREMALEILMRGDLIWIQQHAPPPPPSKVGANGVAAGGQGGGGGAAGGLQEKDAMDYLNEVKRRFTNSPKVSDSCLEVLVLHRRLLRVPCAARGEGMLRFERSFVSEILQRAWGGDTRARALPPTHARTLSHRRTAASSTS